MIINRYLTSPVWNFLLGSLVLAFMVAPTLIKAEESVTVEVGYEKNGQLIETHAMKADTINRRSLTMPDNEKYRPVFVVRNGGERRIDISENLDRLGGDDVELWGVNYPLVAYRGHRGFIQVYDLEEEQEVWTKRRKPYNRTTDGNMVFFGTYTGLRGTSDEDLQAIDLTGNDVEICTIMSPERQDVFNDYFRIMETRNWKWLSGNRFWGMLNHVYRPDEDDDLTGRNYIFEIEAHSCDDFEVKVTDVTDQVEERYFQLHHNPDDDLFGYKVQIERDRDNAHKLSDGRYYFHRTSLGDLTSRYSHMFYTKDLKEVWQEYNQRFSWLYWAGAVIVGLLAVGSFWYPLWRALALLTTMYVACIIWINYAFVSIYSNWGGPVGNQILNQAINVL